MLGALLLASAPSGARAVPAGPASSFGGLAWFMLAFELGPWEDYLIQELTPDLERLGGEPIPSLNWLSLDQEILLPDFALALLRPTSRRPGLAIMPHGLSLQRVASSPDWSQGQRLERSVMMPGITAQVSERSALSVSAVLATQRFVAAGMNLSEHDDLKFDALQPQFLAGRPELAQGAGVRFALAGAPTAGLTLEASFQSRIDMSDMASIRGVHGSQAELDIPSRLQLGLQVQTGQRSSIHIGAAQIFYSEVGAFPSRALPARFNALLGDSTSPQFDWEDLVVYSLGWAWRHESNLELVVDYRTRSQPRPRSPILAAALAPELAHNALLMGLSKRVNERSRLQLNAAYAPPEFVFGGHVLGVVSDRLDQSLELQAIWRHEF